MVRRSKIEDAITDPVEAALQREIVRRQADVLPGDFYEFVKAAWDQVEQFPFRDGWHIQAICDHLQACAERRIKRLCINISPRCGKSVLCSVLFPAWILARSPKETCLFASYSAVLANRDSVKCRMLIESDWYQARFPHVQIKGDSNLKTAFVLTAGGGRHTTSVGGTVTGLGGSFLVLDDPISVQDGESDVIREDANMWFREAWLNRVAGDPEQAVRIVIMQRVHQSDVSEICAKTGWTMLELPMEFEGNSEPNAYGWKDPRTEPGQLMWPGQWSRESLDGLKETMTPYAWASQYQQRPVPRGGGTFQSSWLRFWWDPRLGPEPAPVRIRDADGFWIECKQKLWAPKRKDFTGSFDCAFKETKTSDFVVGQVWTRDNADYFLVDQRRRQADLPATLEMVRDLYSIYRMLPTLVEEKANGAAVISSLQNEIDGMIPINPEGGKLARANAVAPLFQAGNVYLPHPDMFPWVKQAVEEITFFPKSRNDDVVDAMSQALVWMRERKSVLIDAGAEFGGKHSGGFETGLVTPESYFGN